MSSVIFIISHIVLLCNIIHIIIHSINTLLTYPGTDAEEYIRLSKCPASVL